MIAAVFALEFESAVFRARQKEAARMRMATWHLGAMGDRAADALDRRLTVERPRLVISAGFAGALQPGIAVADMVLGKNYSEPGLVEALKLSSAWHIGDLRTEPAIIEKAADKRRLGEETGCLAGDMETAHLWRICVTKGIPMLAVRCISDALEDDMPVPAATLVNPESFRPDPLGLFKHLITNPASVPGFNALLKNAKKAQEALAAGLEEIIPQLLKVV